MASFPEGVEVDAARARLKQQLGVKKLTMEEATLLDWALGRNYFDKMPTAGKSTAIAVVKLVGDIIAELDKKGIKPRRLKDRHDELHEFIVRLEKEEEAIA